jgi:hypothetical protein
VVDGSGRNGQEDAHDARSAKVRILRAAHGAEDLFLRSALIGRR